MRWSDRLEPADLHFIQRLIDYSRALGFLNRDIKVSEIVDQSWQKKAELPATPPAAPPSRAAK